MNDRPDGHDLYYRGRYWNDLALVRRHLNERATGDADTSWVQALARSGRRFDRALILNCGNGWVERDLHHAGLVEHVVGIDIDPSLLAEARREAESNGLSAEYIALDINADSLPAGVFDLVVNHAAAHHISYIDRVFRQVADRLGPNGVFVSWDYVGPHRNQYPKAIWDAAQAMNEQLPIEFRSSLEYPNIETMLATDPSEAVHSELVLETIERYFGVTDLRRLGGAIGYLVLSHNDALHDAPPEIADPLIAAIMAADAFFTDTHPEHSLFAFVIAEPATTEPSASDLDRWRSEEDRRERRAARNGGEYGPRSELSVARWGPATQPSTVGRWAKQAFPQATDRYNRLIESIRLARERRRTSPPQ